MGHIPRPNAGGIVYHVLNRANERAEMFHIPGDYAAFEDMLAEVKRLFAVELFAYCVMPNHWHLVLRPEKDGELSSLMHWLTMTHAKRWRTFRGIAGFGHLYQGQYRCFPVQDDRYFLAVCRYVERNALRANLVPRAEDWRWSSLWRRVRGDTEQRRLLDPWPVDAPADYVRWVYEPQSQEELDAIRQSVKRGTPYGDAQWVRETAGRFGLGATLRARGRPKRE